MFARVFRISESRRREHFAFCVWRARSSNRLGYWFPVPPAGAASQSYLLKVNLPNTGETIPFILSLFLRLWMTTLDLSRSAIEMWPSDGPLRRWWVSVFVCRQHMKDLYFTSVRWLCVDSVVSVSCCGALLADVHCELSITERKIKSFLSSSEDMKKCRKMKFVFLSSKLELHQKSYWCPFTTVSKSTTGQLSG